MATEGSRIVLVEDSFTDAKLFERWLKLSGWPHTLRIFRDGIDAIASLVTHRDPNEPLPSFVILDSNLPSMRGRHVLEQLRRVVDYRDVPILLFIDPVSEDGEAIGRGHLNFCQIKPRDAGEFETLVNFIRANCEKPPAGNG